MDPDASEILEVRRALAEERALREALEADLQRSAQIGQELLLKNEELEQVVKEHAEKTAQVARRASNVEPVRRACTVPLGPKEATAEEEESDSELPTSQLLRRGRRAGKTVMVEELMSANLSLHDDLMRLKDEQRQAGLNGYIEAREEGIQNVDEEESNLLNELQHRVSILESGRRQLQKELGASQEKAARAQRLEEELEATRISLHLAQGQLAALEEVNRALRTSQRVWPVGLGYALQELSWMRPSTLSEQSLQVCWRQPMPAVSTWSRSWNRQRWRGHGPAGNPLARSCGWRTRLLLERRAELPWPLNWRRMGRRAWKRHFVWIVSKLPLSSAQRLAPSAVLLRAAKPGSWQRGSCVTRRFRSLRCPVSGQMTKHHRSNRKHKQRP